MSRRRSDAAKRKKRKPFQPDFHGLEKRMMPATFLVSTAADSGAGSLRQAITDSNCRHQVRTRSTSALARAPRRSRSCRPCRASPYRSSIDGTTQSGYANAPLIDLDGTSAGSSANGLDLATGSGGSTIRALVINNFTADGILITTAGNTVRSSYIGTNAAGSAAGSQPMAFGVFVTAGGNNTIGGTAAAHGNLISGNSTAGVVIEMRAQPATSSQGNLIGTNAAGTAPCQTSTAS